LQSHGINSLNTGLNFPPSFLQSIRKIGNHPDVLNAVNDIKQHLDEVYYLAIVPDNPERVQKFFANRLKNTVPSGYVGCDVKNYRYLCWSEIEDFYNNFNLTNTLDVFNLMKDRFIRLN